MTTAKRCKSSICWEQGIDFTATISVRCLLKSGHKGQHRGGHLHEKHSWSRGNRIP